MPTHLRALVVVLLVTFPVLWLLRRAAVPALTTNGDFALNRNLWIGITLAGFLSHNIWIFYLLTFAGLAWAAQRSEQRLATYLFVMFAMPMLSIQIPGFGILQHLLTLTYPRLLSLCLLLPACIAIAGQKGGPRLGSTLADKFLIGHLALQVAFNALLNSFTGTMRECLYLAIDIFLPYYVASRAIRSVEEWKQVLVAMAAGLLLIAPLALIESVKGWLLYSGLDEVLGAATTPFGVFLSRGDALRAVLTSGHAIALGFSMTIALFACLFIAKYVRPRNLRVVGAVIIIAGVVAPLSKGPWMGALAGLLVLLLTSPHLVASLGKSLVAFAIGAPFVLMTSWGQRALDYLPFVGNLDTGSVSYRQRLIEVSLDVLAQNPIFGVYSYMHDPRMEEMRQGQGIIDMVNTYLGVAMASGIVGLVLFAGASIAGLGAALFRWKQVRHADTDLDWLGRCLMAAQCSVLVCIGTVSPIDRIPLFYWLLTGMTVGYAKLVESHLASAASFTPRPALRPMATSGLGRRVS